MRSINAVLLSQDTQNILIACNQDRLHERTTVEMNNLSPIFLMTAAVGG